MEGNGFYFPSYPAIDLAELQKAKEEENKLGDTIQELQTEISESDLKDYLEESKNEYR